jgi:hypothetical protein
MRTPFSTTPIWATVRRDDERVELRAKLPDVDPATIHARIVDGELVVTARSRPSTGTATAPADDVPRHRLVDLGPRLQPLQ